MSRQSLAGPPPPKVRALPVVVYAATEADAQLCARYAAVLHWRVVATVADAGLVVDRMTSAGSSAVFASFDALWHDPDSYQLRAQIESVGGTLFGAAGGA